MGSGNGRMSRTDPLGHILTVVEAGHHELALQRWGRIAKPIAPAGGSVERFQLNVGDFVVVEKIVNNAGPHNSGVMIAAVRRVRGDDWATQFEVGFGLDYAPELQLSSFDDTGFEILETPGFVADVVTEWRDKNPPREKYSVRGIPTPWILPMEWVAGLSLRKKSPRTGTLEITLNEQRPEDFPESFVLEVKSGQLIEAIESRFADPKTSDSPMADSGESEEPAVDDD